MWNEKEEWNFFFASASCRHVDHDGLLIRRQIGRDVDHEHVIEAKRKLESKEDFERGKTQLSDRENTKEKSDNILKHPRPIRVTEYCPRDRHAETCDRQEHHLMETLLMAILSY